MLGVVGEKCTYTQQEEGTRSGSGFGRVCLVAAVAYVICEAEHSSVHRDHNYDWNSICSACICVAEICDLPYSAVGGLDR